MRALIKTVIILGTLAGIAVSAYGPAQRYWHERNRPKFRTVEVEEGGIVFVRNATGRIEPVLSVHVGAFVSGPITRLHVDFNDEVKEGDLLAEIDTQIYDASVARDRAALATRRADLERVKARLQNAKNDERRALGLREDNEDFISDTELDQYVFARMALEAELLLAQASIEQAVANLSNSKANLAYTEITSPVDGMILDRQINPGQTLTSQFQTPELFIIAPEMREEMHVFASVDETDIGLIREAKEEGQPVKFTVYAYPGELFDGTVSQIRLNSEVNQNVVTYSVVISASNEELKLLPGMTADISFQIEEKHDVVKIPNSAIRFFPEREHVREDDRDLLDGVREQIESTRDSPDAPDAVETAAAARNQRNRHVWVRDGDLLRAVAIVTGISDYKFTELVSGDLSPGDELVEGLETK